MKFALTVGLLASLMAAACGNVYSTPESSSLEAENEGTRTIGFNVVQQSETVHDSSPTGTPTPTEAPVPTETPAPVQALVAPAEAATYHDAQLEPCVAVEGSRWDPCDPERDKHYEPWQNYIHPDETFHVAVEGSYINFYPPLTTRQIVRREFEEERVPHVVVRGVYRPGTTRCTSHDQVVHVTSDGIKVHTFETVPQLEVIECYIEFDVREYLYGQGPGKLTLSPETRLNAHRSNRELYKTDRYLKPLASELADMWEGAEAVVWLVPNVRMAHSEVWKAGMTFDVQRADDGRVVVVGYGPFGPRHYGANQDLEPYQDRIWPDLSDYRREIVSAIEEFSEEFDATLIRDANQIHLRNFIKNLGVHDLEEIEIVQPPPPPNE